MHTFASRVGGAVLDCQRYMAMVKLTLFDWVVGSLGLVFLCWLAVSLLRLALYVTLGVG